MSQANRCGGCSFPGSGSSHSHHLGTPSCNEPAQTPRMQQGHEQIQPGQVAAAAEGKGVVRVSPETPIPGGAPAPASNSPNGCLREIKATFLQSLFSRGFSPSAQPKPGHGLPPCTPRKGGAGRGGPGAVLSLLPTRLIVLVPFLAE